MENATKALAMAGGVLIAIMLLATLVYVFQNAGLIPQAELDQKAVEELVKFNSQYESYNKQFMYGTDVISVINKARDNNTKYSSYDRFETYYKIEVEVTLKVGLEYKYSEIDKKNLKLDDDDVIVKEGTYNLESPSLNTIYNNSDAFTDFKRRNFKCTCVDYNEYTGTVKKMTFTEIQMSEDYYINYVQH